MNTCAWSSRVIHSEDTVTGPNNNNNSNINGQTRPALAQDSSKSSGRVICSTKVGHNSRSVARLHRFSAKWAPQFCAQPHFACDAIAWLLG